MCSHGPKLLVQYRISGVFEFDGTEELPAILRQRGVPEDPGVYLIYEYNGQTEELIYIGKAGSIRADGSVSKQGLFSRLKNKQDGVPRQTFFSEYIQRENAILKIRWFVTYDPADRRDIPALVEVNLLQEYLLENGNLPKFNKSI